MSRKEDVQKMQAVSIKRTALIRYTPMFTTAPLVKRSDTGKNGNKGNVISESDDYLLPLVRLLYSIYTQSNPNVDS